jgi:hypothetical protein
MNATDALAKTLRLTIEETLAIVRRRYPQGLMCSACARVLATQSASYTKSNLTEQDSTSFVCGECKQDAIEPERLSAQMAERARRTLHAPRRKPPLVVLAARGDDDDVWTAETSCSSCGLLLTNREMDATGCSRCSMARADATPYGKVSPERLRYLSLGKPQDYGCATGGRHHTLEVIAECPFPTPILVDVPTPLAMCPHARPQEACLSCWRPKLGDRSKRSGKRKSRSRSARLQRTISGPSRARRPRLGLKPRRVRRLSPEALAAARARMARINARRLTGTGRSG